MKDSQRSRDDPETKQDLKPERRILLRQKNRENLINEVLKEMEWLLRNL